MHFGLPVVPDEYRMYSGWSKGSEAKDAAPPLTPNSCQRLARSEEHTSELQSRLHLVCRLLLEKKKPPCRRISHHGAPCIHNTPTWLTLCRCRLRPQRSVSGCERVVLDKSSVSQCGCRGQHCYE